MLATKRENRVEQVNAERNLEVLVGKVSEGFGGFLFSPRSRLELVRKSPLSARNGRNERDGS